MPGQQTKNEDRNHLKPAPGRGALKVHDHVNTVEPADGQGDGHDDGGSRSTSRTSFHPVDEGPSPGSRDSRAVLSEDLPTQKTRNSTPGTQRRENKAMKLKPSKPKLATTKIFFFHLVSFETYTCGDR